MAQRKRRIPPRWPRLLPGPALALAAALAAAGCTSAPASTPAASGSGAHGTAPAVTMAQARGAFDAYVATTAKAARASDGALALSVVTGMQHALLSTALNSRGYTGSASQGAYGRSLRVTPARARYTYGTPAFYLPEAAGYPRFFVVAVTRTLKSTCARREKCIAFSDHGSHMTTQVGGVMLPVDGPVLMLFEQAAAGARWLLASISRIPAGGSLPRLATDGAGHIPVVPLSAGSLLARPDVTGPLQAAVVDDGPASAAAKAVADGPLTTGMYQGARDHQVGVLAPPAGDIYQWELEGSPYPAFALRTADGGALVFYVMYLNATVAVPGYISKADPIPPGPPIRVPADLLTLLPASQQAPRVHLESQQLLSFAAIDPPPGPAKIRVIAIGGGLNWADAS